MSLTEPPSSPIDHHQEPYLGDQEPYQSRSEPLPGPYLGDQEPYLGHAGDAMQVCLIGGYSVPKIAYIVPSSKHAKDTDR